MKRPPPPRTTPGYDPVAEAESVRRERARRDRELTPSQRLERLHRLCASLSGSRAPRA